MGEIADMMINGSLCVYCGCYLELDEEPGFPVYCSAECREEHGVDSEGITVDQLNAEA